MILSSQQLAEVIEHMRSAESSEGAERRRVARISVQFQVQLTSLGSDAGHTFSVLVRDISGGGMGLYAARSLRRGDSFLVRLPRGGRDQDLLVVGEIAYTAAQADGLFSVGFMFSGMANASHAKLIAKAAEAERARISKSVLG